MARNIIRGLIGQEDLNIGSGTFTRSTSTGGVQTLHQITFAGSVLNFFDNIIPTGTINGVNQVFTLPNIPNPPASLLLFLQGVLQQQGVGNDYTLSGNTITFAIAPNAGPLLAWGRF